MPASSPFLLPLYATPVAAGFPAPADDAVDEQLNIHEHIVRHPASTFFVRVAGDSMKGAGIFEGDILAVDRSLPPKHRDIVIGVIEGEFTVKRFEKQGNLVTLIPENTNYAPIPITPEIEAMIWGVVIAVVRKYST